MSDKQDFEFMTRLADEFFREKHVGKMLKTFSEAHMTGWEKWLQIEFAAFLSVHENVTYWWRESRYQIDQRIRDSRKVCAVDFLI